MATNRIEPRSVTQQSRLSTAVLSAGFSFTGSGTVMLGVILPAISKQWGFQDSQLGTLLFLQFFGSGLGAVFAGLNRIRSIKIGFGLVSVALCTLIFTGSRYSYSAFLIYGIGLGMAMTATSQLFSDVWEDNRAAKLEWLNFVWSAGAMIGPICFLPFLRQQAFQSVFVLMLSLFVCIFCLVMLIGRVEPKITVSRIVKAPSPAARIAFSAFLVLAMCFVGVEASLSGWLTTYSSRAGIHSLAGASVATSLFWFGEMASRLIFSTRLLANVGRAAILTSGIFGVTATTFALIGFPHPWSILILAGAAGYFIGPLYPLALSYLMELSPWGWFFAAGGIGAAIFPWMTGLISERFHSLRFGLVVPCVAGLMMIVINVLALRALESNRRAVHTCILESRPRRLYKG
jgi:MFS transporter, FHS family, glucose/mannose:H+ symporter